MKLYVRLHNSVAVTGLLRRINLSLWHIHSGGQISWSWPWSTGSINHDLIRQEWCHTELAGRSTYQSRHVQGRSDPWWRLSLITLNRTVTHNGILVGYGKQTGYEWKSQLNINVREHKSQRLGETAERMVWRHFLQAAAKPVTQIWRQKDDFSQSHGNNDQAQAGLCFLFQTFSIKSIVSWPLECNFSLLSLLFHSLRDWDHYCMKWCTLLWLCLTFIAFSFLSFFFSLLHFCIFFFFPQEAVLFSSPIWLHFIIRLTRTGTYPLKQRHVTHLQTCTQRMIW